MVKPPYSCPSATGHLLFARESALYAISFDIGTLETTGTAQAMVDEIAVSSLWGDAAYALSDDGVLVYVASEDLRSPKGLVSIDRVTGQETDLPVPEDLYEGLALSPDGRSLALAVSRPGEARNIVVADLAQGRLSSLAQGPDDQFEPIWTPDGRRVVFACKSFVADICAKTPNSSESQVVLYSSDFDKQPYAFTSGGTRLILAEDGDEQRFLSISLNDPEAMPDTLLEFGTARASALTVSPDGRWIAYVSDETGEFEVWLESLDPSVRRRWNVSSGDGFAPRWSREGRELVYRGDLSDHAVFAVAVDPDTGEPGTPERLFADPYYAPDYYWYRFWDVASEGQQFIMIKEPQDRLPRRLVVVTNFFEELRQRMGN